MKSGWSLIALAMLGCDPTPHGLQVAIGYADPTLDAEVLLLEVVIVQGDCTVTTEVPEYDSFVLRDERPDPVMGLGPGLHAFRARAGTHCDWIAEVCVEQTLPLPEETIIALDLERLREMITRCPPDQFCVDGACADRTEEVCDARDNDGDGVPDEDFDLTSDEANCGECRHVCTAGENATVECLAGSCDVTCNPGYGDCDTDGACETNLLRPETCGDCDTVCSGATPACSDGGCVSGCPVDTTDCSGSCVDLGTDLSNCGACGVGCTTGPGLIGGVPVCNSGVCELQCPPGEDPCDGVCVDLNTSVMHCGACGVVCMVPHATPLCVGGDRCGVDSCDRGWGRCDTVPGDGCETPLGTLTNCMGCGDACDAGETCCFASGLGCWPTSAMCRAM